MNSTEHLLLTADNMSSSSSTTLHPPPTSHLTSIPTEILLRVISHLPFTTDFLSLVQTSHGFRLFFKQHARQICNTHIVSWYSTEAEILETVLLEGWFVPTHPCVKKQERLLLKEKWKDCAACSRPSSSSSSPRIEAASAPRNGETGEEVIPDQSSTRRSPCMEQHEKSLKMALSAPGPQYLRFLEEYSFEILVRYQVEVDKLAKKGNWKVGIPEASISSRDDGGNQENENKLAENGIVYMSDSMIKRSKVKRMTDPEFEWKVGTYAVRRFLLKLDAFASYLSEPPPVDDSPTTVSSALMPCSDAEKERREKKGVLTNFLAGIGRMGKVFKGKKRRKLGFREIVEDEKSAGADMVTVGVGTDKKCNAGSTRIRGLLWYYGGSGVLKCPDVVEGRLGWARRKEIEVVKCREEDINVKVKTGIRGCGAMLQKLRSVCMELQIFGCVKGRFDELESVE